MVHAAPSEDAEGAARVIAGRYRLHAPIGAGGMGEVWRAYDERLDRRVAVKMMLAENPVAAGLQDDDFQESLRTRQARFLREVRTTASLEHLGIPAVYDTGVDDATGRLFVVMQLLQGRELQTVINETDYADAPVPVSWAAAAGAQIASVLDVVHRHDVVHRDIKPSNLMLTPGGVVKVLDFGVAALLGAGTNPRLTQVGMTVGTPPYMSPEQSLANAVGPAADIYALACVLYEVLTGELPFPTDDSRSYAWHHVHTPPPPIRTLRPDVPKALENLLLTMLSKESEQRLAASEVYEALLPWTQQPEAGAAGQPGAAEGADLDPQLPFIRPFGGATRRTTRATYPPTLPIQAEHPTVTAPVQSPLTGQEADATSDSAQRLAKEGQFAQAADLLAEAIARADNPSLREDLLFRLAQVKFLGGSHHEAVGLFEEVRLASARRYGPADDHTLLCLYYVAQCRMELGEVTAAISAFGSYLAQEPNLNDREAVARYLDALTRVMRLHSMANRFTETVATAKELREATRRLLGDHAPELTEIDGFLARLRGIRTERQPPGYGANRNPEQSVEIGDSGHELHTFSANDGQSTGT
ncbi:MAG: protein kinase domain-containing protein [Pseudonocardiaceae bacterium]